MTLQSNLASLRDINGVTGSFLVSIAGQLVARDTPELLNDEVLEPLAPRIVRLWETLREVDKTLDQAVITYESQKLYLRPVVQGLLCAIVPLGTNMAALRMAVNLLVKKVNPRMVALHFDGEVTEDSRGSSPNAYRESSPPHAHRESSPPQSYPGARDTLPPPETQHSSAPRYIVHRGRRYLA